MSELKIGATKPESMPARNLRELGNEVLPCLEEEGDVDRYLLSSRLAVERRNGTEFLNGITDKTLFTSAIYPREYFNVAVKIAEGERHNNYTMYSPQAVRGTLTSMLLQYGINIPSTPDLDETVALIAMMTRREQVGIPEISLIPKRKASGLADIQKRIVEMLPGCGMVMARNLLQRFGTVRRIMDAIESAECP